MITTAADRCAAGFQPEGPARAARRRRSGRAQDFAQRLGFRHGREVARFGLALLVQFRGKRIALEHCAPYRMIQNGVGKEARQRAPLRNSDGIVLSIDAESLQLGIYYLAVGEDDELAEGLRLEPQEQLEHLF